MAQVGWDGVYTLTQKQKMALHGDDSTISSQQR